MVLSLSAEGDVTDFLHEIVKIRTSIFNIKFFLNSHMMNRILRHFNCDLTDFRLDWTLLQNWTREAPQDGVGHWRRGGAHISRP